MAISISLPKVEYNSTDLALSEIRCALWRNNDTLSHPSSSWLLWQHDEGLFISSMVTWQTEPPSHREWYDWCVEAMLMFMYHQLYRQQLPTVHAELNTASLWATFSMLCTLITPGFRTNFRRVSKCSVGWNKSSQKAIHNCCSWLILH